MKIQLITLSLILLTFGCATVGSHSTSETIVTQKNNLSKLSKRPMVKPSPAQYPIDAANKGIEGWVQLNFDINAQGNTENISVLKSSPKGVFDQAAIKSLSKWEYRPKIVNGEAVHQHGQTIQLDFTLSDKNEVKSDSFTSNFIPRPPNKNQLITDQKLRKSITHSFQLYLKGDPEQALLTAKNIKTSTPFEQAYVNRLIGNFAAENGNFNSAINYLTTATEKQLLADKDHAAAMRLLADLNYQQTYYQAAIDTYKRWINFTGDTDAQMMERIANAELKLSK
ncbi:TonB family protein [Shewanella nanhaiensis]|uniref:Protein TonB n=1 Tax=Shewanella nanhaiensis TaxID=2864872 RepID=A0ABS7DZ80_9GAMM|nr:TonB family protein [Shewanella nanhaiensis]MBW8182739.1 TonB family protein [Shewanella nanhaiensis]